MMQFVTESSLSQDQLAIVRADDPAIFVLASAGSGKTEVVAQRVERLLSGSGGTFRVLALSYTRRAAGELSSRFEQRLGKARDRAETDTIHGFAQSIISQYGSWIGLTTDPVILVDDSDRVDLLQAWRAERGLEPLSGAREQLLRLDVERARGTDSHLAKEWAAALEDAGALDYESMLSTATDVLAVPAIQNLIRRLYRHVIVDESQNLTGSQYALLKQLFGSPGAPGSTNVMLVGDDKQSIIGFAGASADYMLRFVEEYHAKVLPLRWNFRSAETLARLAAVIAAELGDRPGQLQEYAAPGLVQVKEFATERDEAAAVASWAAQLLQEGMPQQSLSPGESIKIRANEIGVLARSAASLRATAEALQGRGIQIVMVSHPQDWLLSDSGRLAWALGGFDSNSAIARRQLLRDFAIASADSADSVRDQLLRDPARNQLAQLVATADPETFILRVRNLELNAPGWDEDAAELETAWRAFCDSQPPHERGWRQFKLFLARAQRDEGDQVGVRLQTVHKSQGREFKAVTVLGLNDGQFPDFRATNEGEMHAELRAFYVAVTRPSRLLLLTRARATASKYGTWTREPSPFLRFAQSS